MSAVEFGFEEEVADQVNEGGTEKENADYSKLQQLYYDRRGEEMKPLFEAFQRGGIDSHAECNVLKWVFDITLKKAAEVFFQFEAGLSGTSNIEDLYLQLERGPEDHAQEITHRVGEKLRAGKFSTYGHLLGYLFKGQFRFIKTDIDKDIKAYGATERFQSRPSADAEAQDLTETDESRFATSDEDETDMPAAMTGLGVHIFQWLSADERQLTTTIRVAEGDSVIAGRCMGLTESAFEGREGRYKRSVRTITGMLDTFRLPPLAKGFPAEYEDDFILRMERLVTYLARCPKAAYPQTLVEAHALALNHPDPIVGANPWSGEEKGRTHLISLWRGKRKNMMLPAESAPDHLPLYELAFRMVMPTFQELYYSSLHHAGTKATNYERNTGGGKATNTTRLIRVSPTDADFTCDVQITARRTLDTFELEYFNEFYLSCQLIVETDSDVAYAGRDRSLEVHLAGMPDDIRDAAAALDASIRHKLGKRFIDVGIAPLSEYRYPVDVSGRTLLDGTKPRRSLLPPLKHLPPAKKPSGSVSVVQGDALETAFA